MKADRSPRPEKNFTPARPAPTCTIPRINPIKIDPDIARAATLPAEVYSSPLSFARQRERLFPHTWHFAGDEDRVKTPGQVVPWTLLPGALDEPLLLTRDGNNRLHCLSNVCTHRGNVVVEGACHAQVLRCRYHGRRFGLDGAFVSMPEFEGTHDFPSAADSLPDVPLAHWGRFLFASLEPSLKLDDVLAPIRARLDWIPSGEFALDTASSRDYVVNANWALYCDNYLEGFHIPYVHQSLAGTLDYGKYRTEVGGQTVLQVGIAAPGEPSFALPSNHPDHGQSVAGYYLWLFPCTMFNFYPWGLSINVVQPLSVDRTRVSFLSYVWDASKRDLGAGSGLDRVEREDEVVVEAVQRGVRSRLYRRGRYSPVRETGVHHFHRLLAAAMND